MACAEHMRSGEGRGVEADEAGRAADADPLLPAQRAPPRAGQQHDAAERPDAGRLRDGEAERQRAGGDGPGGRAIHAATVPPRLGASRDD